MPCVSSRDHSFSGCTAMSRLYSWTTRRRGESGGIQARLQRRIDLLEELVDFPAPRGDEALLPQGRLGEVLKPCGIALGNPAERRLSFDLGNPGGKLRQLAGGDARQVLEPGRAGSAAPPGRAGGHFCSSTRMKA